MATETESASHRLANQPDSRATHRWNIAHSEFSRGWGGQEHRVLAELIGFRQRGCRVSLIAPESSAIAARALREKIPVRFLPISKAGLVADVLGLADWLGRNHVEVLNTHSSRDGWFVALAGRLAGVPLVIRTRHIEVEYRSPSISRLAFTFLADHVLTTSERIRQGLQRSLSLPAEHTSTLPTGIDIRRFVGRGKLHSKIRGLRSPGRKLIGMISVLRSWKGHRTFVDAANRFAAMQQGAEYVIVGNGPYRESIRKRIDQSPEPARFHLLGHVEDVPSVLRGLDVLTIPSLSHEGIPQIGLQALACGVPVVGSDIGGIPEIIRPGETGRIFPAGDAEALATAWDKTLRQKQQTELMSRNGRILVEQQHSRDHMIEILDQLYTGLIRSY